MTRARPIPTTRPKSSTVARWLPVIVVVAFAAALLSGCDGTGTSNTGNGKGSHGDMHVYLDRETGCEYLAIGSSLDGHNVTPRMGADGKQICR